jgi:hypothetical protein
MGTVFDFFALSYKCPKYQGSLLGIWSHLVVLDDLKSFILFDHYAGAGLANALQDIHSLLEVTNMEYRKL